MKKRFLNALLSDLTENDSLQGIVSVGAIVFVSLIPFFAFREIGRVIGTRELWSLLLSRGTKACTLQSRPQ
jgi:hypothetical protein